QPSTLIDDKSAMDLPPVRMPDRFLAGNAISAPTAPTVSGPREGGKAGAGELFSTGDIPVRAGAAAAGGSGADGRAGAGLAAVGHADAVTAAGVTSFARPLGGYQTIPRYPESVRR